MFMKLKAVIGKLAGASAGGKGQHSAETVEYKGYRIIPAPYRSGDQYQVAGAIEKTTSEGVKRHDFIRADTSPIWEDAVAIATAKARQIIDQQGDRAFK
ncbi:MAG TPA: HlyU family transcriptional regulator [Hyphomicrobiaceae bacterium]|jgi:hypothetical protein|nr:HlyU family transcriptional regulator [Hyphomicrobiaceae bacterium]